MVSKVVVTLLALMVNGQQGLYPVPEPEPAYPKVSEVPHAVSSNSELFGAVRYTGKHNIHKCSVPMVVQVPDPCQCAKCTCCKCDACKCEVCDCCKCDIKTVNVEICVPPCGCAEVKHRRNGKRTIYDFGKKEVIIMSVNGKVTVHYSN